MHADSETSGIQEKQRQKSSTVFWWEPLLPNRVMRM